MFKQCRILSILVFDIREFIISKFESWCLGWVLCVAMLCAFFILCYFVLVTWISVLFYRVYVSSITCRLQEDVKLWISDLAVCNLSRFLRTRRQSHVITFTTFMMFSKCHFNVHAQQIRRHFTVHRTYILICNWLFCFHAVLLCSSQIQNVRCREWTCIPDGFWPNSLPTLPLSITNKHLGKSYVSLAFIPFDASGRFDVSMLWKYCEATSDHAPSTFFNQLFFLIFNPTKISLSDSFQSHFTTSATGGSPLVTYLHPFLQPLSPHSRSFAEIYISVELLQVSSLLSRSRRYKIWNAKLLLSPPISLTMIITLCFGALPLTGDSLLT